ncbi:MAG: c-type cytochrome domain-containing protein, partial [Planctomycetaceae bacterium]
MCPGLLRSFICAVVLVSACLGLSCPGVRAQDQSPAAPEAIRHFELQIRPLLAARCYECHDGTRQKGGLRLDSPALILAGGESGPALVPGKPAESLLIQAVRYEGYEMPPTGQLPAAEIQLLVDWVQSGAAMPADAGGGARP